MPTYIYTAKDRTGKTRVGDLEASDQHELANLLRKKDLFLISAKPLITEEGGRFSLEKIVLKLNRITLVQRMMFTRHLAVMIKAGLSINQSLKALARQTKNPNFQKIINKIDTDVRQGQNLSMAMAKYPNIFDELYINMIRVGETSGNIDVVLKNLAEQMQKDHELISRVRGAMIYPIIVTLALFGIGALTMAVTVPKLTAIFIELNVDLPIATQIVIQISNFIQNHALLGLLMLVGLVLIIKILLRNKSVKKLLHKVYLKLPIFGKLITKINSARFSRTFSILIVSGLDIVKALEIVAKTLGNINFQESLQESAKEVRKGQELSQILARYGNIYPPMVIEMIQVGEKTGDIAGILGNLAGFYEEEIDQTTKNLSSVIEPVIMVVIGTAVGFFAIAMLQPIYSMMQGI